jgi:hypothetical protein
MLEGSRRKHAYENSPSNAQRTAPLSYPEFFKGETQRKEETTRISKQLGIAASR